MSDRIAVMGAGSIRQIGTPRDIYDRPAERFVADFIGDTNFLPAQIKTVQGDVAEVLLASGNTITARLPQGVTREGAVTLAVRPEQATLVAPEAGVLTGTIGNIVYFGTDTHIHLTLEDGTAFVLRLQNNTDSVLAFGTGDRAGVHFGAHVAQVLKDWRDGRFVHKRDPACGAHPLDAVGPRSVYSGACRQWPAVDHAGLFRSDRGGLWRG